MEDRDGDRPADAAVNGFEPFRFVFMADCQIGCYASFSGLDEADVAHYAQNGMVVRAVPPVEGLEWDVDRLRTAFKGANAVGPDFVVMGGDMVDDPVSDEQFEALHATAATLDPAIPLHWVPGNHDAAFDTVVPTAQSLAFYRERFGPDRYSFDHKGVTFVVVDTVVWDHPEASGAAWTEELRWLEQVIEDAATRSVHTVVLGHHPLFTSEPDEEDTYWNIPGERRHLLLDLFQTHGVGTMLCGHWHRNGGGSAGDLQVVVTGPVGYPLGHDPSGLRIVDVRGDTIEHEYVALDEL